MVQVGQLIASYRLVRQVGEGGMGTVYEAVHRHLGKRAAIKFLKPELSVDPQIAERFFNEARTINLIQHPGIVNVFEFGELEDGTAYIIMEYLTGETLEQRLDRLAGPMETAEALRLARQAASALCAAHEAGIIHRDLKPENIMIVADPEAPEGERAKILDFGIAKLVEERPIRPAQRKVRTRTGTTMGTPSYMAPEQGRGAGAVDVQADVYSLGVVLYEMLAGRPPFVVEGAGELIAMHIYEAPPYLRSLAPSVHDELAALVHRMLAKEPARRPATREVVAALEDLGAPRATTAVTALDLQPTATPVDAGHGTPVEFSSTLDKSIGQQSAVPGARRLPGRLLLAALLPLVAALLGTAAMRVLGHRPGPHVAAGAGAPERVRWTVRTAPPGAQVVQAADGKVLGTTPVDLERPRARGRLAVVLRHPACEDRSIDLDLSRDQLVDAYLPPRPGAAGKDDGPRQRSPRSDDHSQARQADRGAPRGSTRASAAGGTDRPAIGGRPAPGEHDQDEIRDFEKVTGAR